MASNLTAAEEEESEASFQARNASTRVEQPRFHRFSILFFISFE